MYCPVAVGVNEYQMFGAVLADVTHKGPLSFVAPTVVPAVVDGQVKGAAPAQASLLGGRTTRLKFPVFAEKPETRTRYKVPDVDVVVPCHAGVRSAACAGVDMELAVVRGRPTIRRARRDDVDAAGRWREMVPYTARRIHARCAQWRHDDILGRSNGGPGGGGGHCNADRSIAFIVRQGEAEREGPGVGTEAGYTDEIRCARGRQPGDLRLKAARVIVPGDTDKGTTATGVDEEL